MDQAQLQELRELVEFLKANEVGEFDMERPDLKVRIKFAGEAAVVHPGSVMTAPAAVAHVAPDPATAPAAALSAVPAAPKEKLHEVKSPIVGTFYESPSPEAAPFVKIGDVVSAGQVLCIVEAMKLMNEIEADVAGEIVERIAATGQPVEYGQPLFSIRPR